MRLGISPASRICRLDIVVNNAGYTNLGAVEDITLADFRAHVDANLFGVVNMTKAALPLLRERHTGHLIQVSSIGGRLATLGDPAKVAQVVLAVAEMTEPPLRLILGSEACAYATAAARERAEADAAWHDLTISTDCDDATAADRDPFAAGNG